MSSSKALIESELSEDGVAAYVGQELESYKHVKELKQFILDQAIGGREFSVSY